MGVIGPLVCLSLSSVMKWNSLDPSIWKPVFSNLVLPNKVAGNRARVKCLLDGSLVLPNVFILMTNELIYDRMNTLYNVHLI